MTTSTDSPHCCRHSRLGFGFFAGIAVLGVLFLGALFLGAVLFLGATTVQVDHGGQSVPTSVEGR